MMPRVASVFHQCRQYDASHQNKKQQAAAAATTTSGPYLFPSMMSGFSGGVVEEKVEVKMDSWGSDGRRGEEGKNVGEPRGEDERRGEEPRGEEPRGKEPGTSPLSGTSRAFLLRPGAGLVALTLGGAAGSKVLPKLPGAGSASQVMLFRCS